MGCLVWHTVVCRVMTQALFRNKMGTRTSIHTRCARNILCRRTVCCVARYLHPPAAVLLSQERKMNVTQRLHPLQELLSEPPRGWKVSTLNSFHLRILSSIVVFLTLCLFTRLITGLRASLLRMNTNAQQKAVTRVPYWVPFLGSALSLMRDIDGTVAKGRCVEHNSQFSQTHADLD